LRYSISEARSNAVHSNNIRFQITILSLADYMHLSEKQVYRIVKEQTGKAAKNYINERKLQKAKALLKDTDFSVKEISEKMGFSSEYYFSQFFKRGEGMAPGQFRSNVRFS